MKLKNIFFSYLIEFFSLLFYCYFLLGANKKTDLLKINRLESNEILRDKYLMGILGAAVGGLGVHFLVNKFKFAKKKTSLVAFASLLSGLSASILAKSADYNFQFKKNYGKDEIKNLPQKDSLPWYVFFTKRLIQKLGKKAIPVSVPPVPHVPPVPLRNNNELKLSQEEINRIIRMGDDGCFIYVRDTFGFSKKEEKKIGENKYIKANVIGNDTVLLNLEDSKEYVWYRESAMENDIFVIEIIKNTFVVKESLRNAIVGIYGEYPFIKVTDLEKKEILRIDNSLLTVKGVTVSEKGQGSIQCEVVHNIKRESNYYSVIITVTDFIPVIAAENYALVIFDDLLKKLENKIQKEIFNKSEAVKTVTINIPQETDKKYKRHIEGQILAVNQELKKQQGTFRGINEEKEKREERYRKKEYIDLEE